MTPSIKQTVVLILSLTLVIQCSSSTVFESVPPGATLYINGEIMGQTPYPYTDSKIVGSVLQLEMKKPGYKNLRRVVSKDDQVNVGALIGGIFCLFPFLWLFKYKSFYRYELEPGQGDSTARPY